MIGRSKMHEIVPKMTSSEMSLDVIVSPKKLRKNIQQTFNFN